MNRNDSLQAALETLAHPMVLRGAWLRVDAWYRKGELAPQPELSAWRLHPEAQLRELAEDLRRGKWSPIAWLQVPYPKKGGRLRHYLMPTVRDQVAFMAHMVVLGPILDHQMPTFAFGNRWYRRLAWDRRRLRSQWVQRPYPILSDRAYLPYARSFGLFRRVAHWTVARMTDAAVPSEDYAGSVHVPGDYEPGSLPAWTRKDWWSGERGDSRAYWAGLDIELAYPSVHLDRLDEAVAQAVSRPLEIFEDLFHGCPEVVGDALLQEDVRVSIGRHLTAALRQVRVVDLGIPRDAWAPPREHPLPKVAPDKDLGIPTGLAVSGVLLNVALLEADREIEHYVKETEGDMRGAIVRFADDMYVLSRSAAGLLTLIEVVHGALSGTRVVSLATPNRASNICLNFNKIEPKETREVVQQYLMDNDWLACDNDECGQPLPTNVQGSAPKRLADWWGEGTRVAHQEALERTAIGKGDVGPFVTSLVERLSDVGTETLRQRFGDGAREHLVRLHELARFDIGDEQVREDTRRAFAANRLVRAWLPAGGLQFDESKEIAEIRETVAFVVDRTPWKFALWRAVVRAAARRPLGEPQGDFAAEASEAEAWLSSQLRRIASSEDDLTPAAWAVAWPEEDTDKGHGREQDERWRPLYLSFVRAAFWHALAEVVRDLGRHASRYDQNTEGTPAAAPSLWTARALPEGRHAEVASSLAKIDKWLDVLYPTASDLALSHCPWELDALLDAALSIHTSGELAHAWRSVVSPGPVLRAATTDRLAALPKTARALATSGRLQQTGTRRNRKLDRWALASVQLGQRDNSLADVLFPLGGPVRIRRARENPGSVLVLFPT